MSNSMCYGIVVGVDGSAASNAAIAWAAMDAARRGVLLTLVHVLPSPLLSIWPEPPIPDANWAWREEYARELLDAADAVVGRAIEDLGPITLAHRVLHGAPVAQMVDMSKQATTVVVGRSGRNALHRRFIGSVASGLLHHAHAPVAVTPNVESGEGTSQLPVLLGVDGPPTSKAAIEIAFEEASRLGVGLTALHAWADIGRGTMPAADWERQIALGEVALADRLARWQERYPHVAVDRRLVHGEPTCRLVEASQTAQLTVVGSHGRGGFAGMMLGSVSSGTVQAAHTPVIVARPR